MTDEALTALRALAKAATPGPWRYHEGRGTIEPVASYRAALGICYGPNGPYIAAANPQAIIALLDEIERLRRISEWHVIDTAPRDGTRIDIWVIPPSNSEPGDYPIHPDAQACRIPDASPCYDCAWQNADGRTVTGLRRIDGTLYPDNTSCRASRATHWRPIFGPEDSP